VPRLLTPGERQALKGLAHRLNPVVLIGAGGLTPAVLAEVDRALKAHDLVKIRVMGKARGDRERMLEAICAATEASPVQHIGKVLVIYREGPKEEAKPRESPARKPALRAGRRPPGRPR
jgi:RNA-binding protein